MTLEAAVLVMYRDVTEQAPKEVKNFSPPADKLLTPTLLSHRYPREKAASIGTPDARLTP
jgi:hypothetical protein